MPRYGAIVYLETTILLAWIKNEIRQDHEMEGVEHCIERIANGEIKGITSVNTLGEILEGNVAKEKREFVDRTLGQRRGLELIDVDRRVALLAQEIRQYYRERSKNLKLPDATHLATAIHLRADALYTFDGDDLLPLNGNVAGHNLVICKPPLPVQGKLPFSLPKP